MLTRTHRFFAIAVALVLLTMALGGCGGSIGKVLRIVGLTALLPDSWTSDNRTVRLIADILSDAALLEVVALVTREGDPEPKEVIMTRNDEGKYEGAFEVPVEDSDVVYTAVVRAVDSTGSEAVSEPVQIEAPPLDDVSAP